jgi:HEAT repeat protein
MGIMDLFKPNVEALQAKDNINGLTKALTYKRDAVVRIEAAEALGAMKAEQAVGPLTTALDDQFLDVRLAAAEALSQVGKSALPGLVEGLSNSDGRVASFCAEALGALKAEEAVGPLTVAMDHEHLDVRSKAVKSLLHIGKASLPGLIQGLNNSDIQISASCAEALGAIQDAEASVPLIAAFRGVNRYPEWFCHTVLSALGEIRDMGAIDFLIEQASSSWVDNSAPEEEGSRDKVVIALVRLGLPAVPKLSTAALKNENEKIRQHCVEALGIIGKSDEARKAVLSTLCQSCTDSGYLVKCRSFGALRDIADHSCIETLINGFDDKEHFVRSCAIDALVRIGEGSIHRLTQELDKPDNPRSPQVQETLNRIRVIPRIKEVLLTPSTWERIKPKKRYGDSKIPDHVKDYDVKDYLEEVLAGCASEIQSEYMRVLRELEHEGYLDIVWGYNGVIRKIAWKK